MLRDQDITHEQHKAFGAMFGELEGHPVTTSVPGHPEILVIEAADGLKITDAILPIARPANKWHTDVTFREKPSFAGVCSPSAPMAQNWGCRLRSGLVSS